MGSRYPVFVAIFVCLLVAAVAQAVPDGDTLYPTPVRFHLGDEQRWADRGYDDGSWESARLVELPEDEPLLWIRTTVNLSPQMIDRATPLGLFFAAMASHEIYWDGELIGRGGVVGRTAQEEMPGPIEAQYVVPDRLVTPGLHTIAIRASAFHRHVSFGSPWWALVIGDYDLLLGSRLTYTWIALSSLSGILVGGFFALIMFLTDRRDRPFLVLAILCFIAAALLVAESWRTLFGYTYDLHVYRLLVVTVLSWALSFVLVTFMATRFPMARRWWVVGATGLLMFVPPVVFRGWDSKAGGMLLLGLAVAGVWSVLAIRRRMAGAVAFTLALAVALAAFLFAPFRFANLTLFFSVDLLVVCLLASHAIEARRASAERDEARFRSTRLEAELLRRQIQPHFLMNTLTAISEWIEEDPSMAIEMIQSLSEEMRLLSEISNRPLIPMRDELRLCRLHLAVMGSRRNRSYELAVEGIDPDLLVPPAVFHTLVENAVTHGGPQAGTTLTLSAENSGGRVRYVFEAPFESGEPSEVRERTGLRYVRARLRESFGSSWVLSYGPGVRVWRTEITIPAEVPG